MSKINKFEQFTFEHILLNRLLRNVAKWSDTL